jgi:FKBP-type peptidyl-prolyl cis-trans isomerase 2
MSKAKEGDRVKVYFTGTLADGTIFGQTHEDEPFEFNIGEKSVLPKFESLLRKMLMVLEMKSVCLVLRSQRYRIILLLK